MLFIDYKHIMNTIVPQKNQDKTSNRENTRSHGHTRIFLGEVIV